MTNLETTEKTVLVPKQKIPLDEIALTSILDRKAPQWQLRVLSGSLAGRIFVLQGTMTLGRGEGCQVSLPQEAKSISRQHCKVCVNGQFVTLWDLGSRNGTFLKGERLQAHTPRKLEKGDLLALGKEDILFRLEQTEVPVQGPASEDFTVISSQGEEFAGSREKKLRFGRRPGNEVQISLQETHVSGYHCELFREQGQLFLRDLGSINGTYLNGQRLEPQVAYRVVAGNRFFLGEEKYLFSVK